MMAVQQYRVMYVMVGLGIMCSVRYCTVMYVYEPSRLLSFVPALSVSTF